MNPVSVALLALLAGVVVGVGGTTVLFTAARVAQRAEERAAAVVPQGVLQVLDAMEGAASVLDASLTVVAASPAAPGFGLSAGEVVGVEDLRTLVRAVRASGEPKSTRFRMRRPSSAASTLPSEGRLVSARAAPLGESHILVVVDDVTEQERLEQMRHDFVANTSHELKTPVGAVSLLAEAIDSAADDPEQVRAFAVRIQAEAQRLTRLTDRIMGLSRLQSAEQLAQARAVSVDEVVVASVEAHAVQATSGGVTLVRGGERGAYVMGDPTMLVEAVGNLIANAIAYSPRGGRVGVGVRIEDGAVEIAVTDQGIGIAESDQERIFERFYRADAARSRRTGGTGLGLAIVKHAVQRHGGEVRVWSRLSRGSTFTIRLPRCEPEDDDPPKARRKRSDGKPRARRDRSAGSTPRQEERRP
ncbi:ATP-binding protein [Microbacterium sp. LRZ72]|uniref:sensor histidine kinase n=1 Tax=Microbacterium sp. LRZ72 TaxID=2942481 RepID=UPI0029A6B779|nr:ATP-binding protein [Microbacterium sp. LRZ72]MDX2375954.1 ATP-binding protein [Microbacterium sp. LRZ72]